MARKLDAKAVIHQRDIGRFDDHVRSHRANRNAHMASNSLLTVATSSFVRRPWPVVPACLADHPLNIAETALALRVRARALVQPLGALLPDVRGDARSPGSLHLPLDRSHSVSEAITDQPRGLVLFWKIAADADDGVIEHGYWESVFPLQLGCSFYCAVINCQSTVQGNCMPLNMDPTRFQPLQPRSELLPGV